MLAHKRNSAKAGRRQLQALVRRRHRQHPACPTKRQCAPRSPDHPTLRRTHSVCRAWLRTRGTPRSIASESHGATHGAQLEVGPPRIGTASRWHTERPTQRPVEGKTNVEDYGTIAE